MAEILPAPVRKRARSPSPPTPGDMHSPIDVLMKRRRKDPSYVGRCASWNGPSFPHPSLNSSSRANSEDFTCPFTYIPDPRDVGPSTYSQSYQVEHVEVQPGIDRRRARQWERLNAPLPTLSSAMARPRAVTHDDQRGRLLQVNSSPYGPATDSPIPQRPIVSQPTPSRAVMSSSPIRHLPPGSSPFKDGHGVELDPWDVEEMRREWGEYGDQNELLHSLHLSRSYTTSHDTPDQTLLQTPAQMIRPHPHATSSISRLPPSSLTHPSSTQFAAWRMNHFPSSSPVAQCSSLPVYSPLAPSEMGDHGRDDEDERMEILDEAIPGTEMIDVKGAEMEVIRRYEETNRLLGELAVVRRQRWGGPDTEGHGM